MGLPGGVTSENFNPPSPCGEGPKEPNHEHGAGKFQSTLPVWGGTMHIKPIKKPCSVFQSTLPVWGGTLITSTGFFGNWISIHPPRVGRDFQKSCVSLTDKISIHPPRVGRDAKKTARFQATNISIHPPRVGRDEQHQKQQRTNQEFQSTLPVWGGTRPWARSAWIPAYFNPPSPCGEGRKLGLQGAIRYDFNPPSPCGEGQIKDSSALDTLLFQSTLPVWGGTAPAAVDFDGMTFQSTLPVWGGTV